MAKTVASARHILLLRGVNVGGNKKVPMADLRTMLSGLGHTNVRTLLNSGNAVFDVPRATPVEKLTSAIESAIQKTFGFTSRSFVLTAADLDVVIDENTLAPGIDNPSRLLVAFLAAPAGRGPLEPLAKQVCGAGALVVGSRAAYLWCPDGILESELPDAVGRTLKGEVTTRNWATVLKLQALCREG